eukprot:scaffold45555_cov52-Attheya_sp.AAC.1
MSSCVRRTLWLAALALFAASSSSSNNSNKYGVSAYSFGVSSSRRESIQMAATVDAPTREKTDRKTDRKTYKDDEYRRTRRDNGGQSRRDMEGLGIDEADWSSNGRMANFEWNRDGPLEYLQDDDEDERNPDDPFHILLLGATFEKERISENYVSSSLSFVLDMPEEEALELTRMAETNGMSCLGTWSHEESLRLGKQLQVRDLAIRVVPFCQGGQRGWQANKDAADASAGADTPFVSNPN